MSGRDTVVVIGGIGSGKTLFVSHLTALGWKSVDADQIGHQVLQRPEVVKEVKELWPWSIRESVVDRSALADIVFSSPRDLAVLEKIVQPRVKIAVDEWLTENGPPRAVEVSVPKVVGNWGRLVLLNAPDEVRLARAVGRGSSPDGARRRMEVQPSRDRWLELADIVVDNSGTLSMLAGVARRFSDWALEG